MNIKTTRKEKGLTQQQLADLAKVHRHTIRNAEQNKTKLETMIHLKKTLRLLPLLICFTASAQKKKIVLDTGIGMTGSLRPAAIVRGLVTDGVYETGIGIMYPSAIVAHFGYHYRNVTPYLGIGSEAVMVGIKWHCYNAIAMDASITGRNFRLTFGYTLFNN